MTMGTAPIISIKVLHYFVIKWRTVVVVCSSFSNDDYSCLRSCQFTTLTHHVSDSFVINNNNNIKVYLYCACPHTSICLL